MINTVSKINLLINIKDNKQAGAGVVPSSGLARSWSKVEVCMKSRWSLDVKVWNILQKNFLIGGQECVENIPFPVYKTSFGPIDKS